MISPPLSELPDPLRSNNGEAVRTAAQWRSRRKEICEAMLPLAYGELPPAPTATRGVLLHTAQVRRLGGARLMSMRVEPDGAHAFALRLFVPAGPGPFPVLVNGDGCWHYASDRVIAQLLRRGYALAQFNRVELAADVAGGPTSQPPCRLFADRRYAALAMWAWGYQRAVDVLLPLELIDRHRIAVVGHSRGGKAALLAGACDERIALTSANNSGAGGAGSFRWQGPGAETLADIVAAFPHWFGPHLPAFAGREHELPFDQHYLKALVAPRALLTTEALGDHWANPMGSWQTHLAARGVYALLGVPDNIAIAFRSGGHDHSPRDWTTLLDYCDSIFRGRPRAEVLQANPFPRLPAPASWCRDAARAGGAIVGHVQGVNLTGV